MPVHKTRPETDEAKSLAFFALPTSNYRAIFFFSAGHNKCVFATRSILCHWQSLKCRKPKYIYLYVEEESALWWEQDYSHTVRVLWDAVSLRIRPRLLFIDI